MSWSRRALDPPFAASLTNDPAGYPEASVIWRSLARAGEVTRPTVGSRVARTFLAGSSGTAAVEFAILGGVFTVLLCFMIELGMTILMQSMLNDAARDASRLIRIGTIQKSGSQPGPFQAALCAKVSPLMACSLVRYNVVAGDSFSALPMAAQTNTDDQSVDSHFLPGTANQDVIVQVGYTRDLYFPILRDLMGNKGKLLIESTVVFQNEPF